MKKRNYGSPSSPQNNLIWFFLQFT
jgi:hypothetical protein